jgi:osmotically-inducible protein OsmY
MYGLLLAVLAGAALAFFFDPDTGGYRRSVARDRIAGIARRGARQAERQARRVGSDVEGLRERAEHAGEPATVLDDATLAQKVMSELFRDRRIPKGSINVNVVGGVVQLRGEVERPDQIEEIVERTTRIEGVADVENLLHPPGTPTPRS